MVTIQQYSVPVGLHESSHKGVEKRIRKVYNEIIFVEIGIKSIFCYKFRKHLKIHRRTSKNLNKKNGMEKMGDSILDVIKKRRSIRKYKKENVPKILLLQLIEAAIWAPSGSNVQPWYFIIIDDVNIIEQVNVFSPGLSGEPPNIILICSDRKKAFEKAGILGRDELCVMDISMAAQNIMLLAEEMGLNTCPVKSFNKRAVSKILNLPNYISADLIISIGYSDEITSIPNRINIKEVTFFNRWGGGRI